MKVFPLVTARSMVLILGMAGPVGTAPILPPDYGKEQQSTGQPAAPVVMN
jgi:hypothetical protein